MIFQKAPLRLHIGLTVCILSIPGVAHAQTSATLAHIRATNTLTCGVNQEEAEFSTSDDHGSREAFDHDLCKAVATAILGPHAQVAYAEFPDDATGQQALRTGAIDMIATQTADFAHAAPSWVAMTRPVLYDGLALMVPKKLGITQARQLAGKKICFIAETETEVSLRAWFIRERLDFVPFPFQEEGEMQAAYATGNCAALAGDGTRLANTRLAFGKHADDYALLPELLSKDPLAIATRSTDADLSHIAAWTVEILLQAEEDGVTAANVEAMRRSEVESIGRLLGRTHELGAPLGLAPDWAAQLLKATGNYGEIYERDLGAASPLKLARGPNTLWSHGGLMMALPLK
ncbi:general L-amino acid transport system substrate-binding protein [Granulicella rosea]|uniref:General L-amino acid transport system substrate-binding protein n=1 Tax=Granulicella rosea TaxID=474952 RepID=A0A239CYS6_9BACT|nr:transporter substrate-binding domain-containing protein [Granulicella rosea]SNS24714.1 general L-amino acid transport system substrate-binding protein [Granulicella rosea]